MLPKTMKQTRTATSLNSKVQSLPFDLTTLALARLESNALVYHSVTNTTQLTPVLY